MDKSAEKDLILKKSNIGIWAMEFREGQHPRLQVDETLKDLLGVKGQDMSGEEIYDFWYENVHPDYYDAIRSTFEKMLAGQHAEVQYPWSHPNRGTVFVRCGGIRDDSCTECMRVVGSHQDMSKIHRFNKDQLTGLYTKEYFFTRVEEILRDNPDRKYRILVSDIVNFKMVNEKYGVEKADELLRYLAKMEKSLMGNDYLLGARLNADKFCFLQYAAPQTREEGLRMAQQVLENAPVPNIVWKHGIYYVDFERDIPVQTMCDRARYALDSIKGIYGINCAIYNDKLQDERLVELQIVDNMEDALAREEFQVYLQPKHDVRENRTGGAEALVRWVHPSFGFMSPGKFIPVFEKNGFIEKLDRYVLKSVCEILKRWMDEGRKIVPISVNCSRRDFERADLAEQIMETVDQYGIPHEMLHIEITESIFSDNPEQTTEIIHTLHKNGFVIELDDFGTGYSSLMTLSELELDYIKLDMSIIQKDKNQGEKNVLNFCTQLGQILNLKSVAEGVETKEQLNRLVELGCDYIQGYYFSKPLTVEGFEEYIDRESQA